MRDELHDPIATLFELLASLDTQEILPALEMLFFVTVPTTRNYIAPRVQPERRSV